MRFRWLTLAAVAALGIYASLADAATTADYLAIREKTQITALQDYTRLSSQFSMRGGKVIELIGDITGVFTGDAGTGYLLKIDDEQTMVVYAKSPDADIAVDNTLRVLVRIPATGTVLEHVSAAVDNLELAQAAASTPGNDIEPVTPTMLTSTIPDAQVPVVRYYRAPEFAPQQPPQPTAPPPGTPLSEQPEVVQIYARRMQDYNSRLDSGTATRIAISLLRESADHGVDPRLVFAMIVQESRFNTRAVSPAGAMGLGQLMPGTAAGLGVRDAFDIQQNMCGTVRYIAGQLKRFGRLSLALAAYNAGPGAVNRYGGIPPYRETQNYVSRIWRLYAKLAGIDPDTGRTASSL